ncbi:hypothetical protein DCS_04331 [Drechmeria coniospora]|uniref:Zn(2)-C6 fungal-type domain-containing protein n=1 Tax=Drechmeria coniospora TaxID=98403 RepID=A0A151GJL6_DRECN|nr:hypothetical protein DCS_04331 [Drechmeria coniospora]KYK57323.1 hypothetical protein DCS_04331 [Drechmeria coniospora]
MPLARRARGNAINAAADSRSIMSGGNGRTATPVKGCSTCTKRRIRCDLTQPTCKKCEKKGLTCPGYGPRLRWAGGVAVRGRLKGQNVPLPGTKPSGLPNALPSGLPSGLPGGLSNGLPNGAPTSSPTSSLAGPPSWRSVDDDDDRGEEGVPVPGHDALGPDPRGPSPDAAADAAVGFADAAAEGAAPRRETVTPACLDQTLRRSAREFIEYYDKNIAGLMVWFDSTDNDYRSSVLPRAANTPGLRLAVAAISAHHGGLTFDHEMPRFSEAARDACLNLIQEHVKDMTGRLTGGLELTSQSDMADAEWMLAAILMISTYEMANGQTTAAESHRMAARTIANVFGHNDACRTRVFDFLRNQLAVLDVLSTSTSFELADVESTVLPPASMAGGLFAQYLTLVHHVTLVSRRRMHAAAGVDAMSIGPDLTPTSVRARFEQARGATLLAAGRLRMPSAVSRDFIRLVDIYHHAGILYSYRCLGLVALEPVDRASSLVKLFEQLAALEDVTMCAPNLPWPAFVAGTECRDDVERREVIATLFVTMTDATGFSHFTDVLRFLRTFWGGDDANWQPLARDLQRKGFRILPL